MRLSDETLEALAAEASAPCLGYAGVFVSSAVLSALIAEVRALRECEKALEPLASYAREFADSGDGSTEHDRAMLRWATRAESSLAAVRALEDQ